MTHIIGDRIANVELDIDVSEKGEVTTSYRMSIQGNMPEYKMENTEAFSLQELKSLKRTLDKYLNEPLDSRLISFENPDFNISLYSTRKTDKDSEDERAMLHGEFIMNFLSNNIPTGGCLILDFNERDIKRFSKYIGDIIGET